MMKLVQATGYTILANGKGLFNKAQATGNAIIANGKTLGFPVVIDLSSKIKNPKYYIPATIVALFFVCLGKREFKFYPSSNKWKLGVAITYAVGTAYALHKKHPLGIVISVYSLAAYALALPSNLIGLKGLVPSGKKK